MHRATCHIIGKPYSHYITLRSQAHRLQCLSLVLMIVHVLYLFFAVNHQLNPLNSMSKLSIYLMQTAAKGSVFRMNLYLKISKRRSISATSIELEVEVLFVFFLGANSWKVVQFQNGLFPNGDPFSGIYISQAQTEIHFREYIFPRVSARHERVWYD